MKQLANKVSKRIRLLQLALCSLIICLRCCFTRAQEGFVSFDCGASRNYTDSNGLEWTSDDTIIYAGNKSLVTPPTNTGAAAQFSTIRYFPGDQSKYCYVFNSQDHGVVQGDAYLVRASFWTGSVLPYETQVKNTVEFKLLLYADIWDDVLIMLPQTSVAMFKEIYVVAMKDTIDVCVAGKGISTDIPFISSLVLRPLSLSMTSVNMLINRLAGRRPLSYMYRINYGALSANTIVSYNEDGSGDMYDRVWQPDTGNSISTTSAVATNVIDNPPVKVMQTAYQNNDSFDLTFQVPSGYFYHYSAFFAELSLEVTLPGQRVFQLQVINGTGSLFAWNTIDLMQTFNSSRFLTLLEYPKWPAYVGIGGNIKFSLIKQNGSTYGPIICGLELLQVSNHDMPLGTDSDEVATLRNITTSYASLSSWSGDPCLPYAYNWLTCTTDTRPSISTMSLSNKSLTGEIHTGFKAFNSLVQLSLADNALSGMIPDLSSLKNLRVMSLANNTLTGQIPDLSSLSHLQVLDLQGNNLSGPIPEFLGDLSSLTTLNLANNNFSGEIPPSLLAKASSNKLSLSIAGNPFLCAKKSNEEHCNALSPTNNTTTNGKQPKSKSSNGALLAGVVAAGVIATLIAIGLLILCIAKQKKKTNKQVKAQSKNEHQESVLPHVSIPQRSNQAPEFTIQAIRKMTRNFERILGQGGFGPVYYGVLENGREVAVKRLAKDSRQGEQEFLNEVELLSRVHHTNLVSLVGYCIESEMILVYEFMANGSLCEALRGKEAKLVSWKDRLLIAVDAAEGLDYLHRRCNPSIIHRDVKSSNILLNEHFEGRISDFGISKTKQYTSRMDGPQTVTALLGSFGYLDPVYAATNIANHSIDVYAFGVVLFEIITGRPPLIQQRRGDQEPQHIVQWAKPLIEQGNISQLVDPRLYQDYNVSSMWKAIEVAMMCVDYDRMRRPRMSEVMAELKSALSMEPQTNLYDTSSGDALSFPYTMDVHTR